MAARQLLHRRLGVAGAAVIIDGDDRYGLVQQAAFGVDLIAGHADAPGRRLAVGLFLAAEGQVDADDDVMGPLDVGRAEAQGADDDKKQDNAAIIFEFLHNNLPFKKRGGAALYRAASPHLYGKNNKGSVGVPCTRTS